MRRHRPIGFESFHESFELLDILVTDGALTPAASQLKARPLRRETDSVEEVGDMIETAMVGRDGVANATSALDGKISLHKAMVQVAGNASVVDPDTLRSIANEIEPLRSLLIRHEQVLFAQAQQSAGCNASNPV